MPRPKEFDPEQVIEEALETFWEHGYSATSVSDLLEEMGLNRGSLYGTFGDKKQLFLAVLDKYMAMRLKDCEAMLEAPGSARAALRGMFEHVVSDCTCEKGRRGCLAAKAAMELAPHDKDVANWFRTFHKRNVAMFANVIRRGQQQGEISKKLDPEAAGRFLLNSLAGLRLLGTTDPNAGEAREVVEMTLKVLELK
ncbi:MAG TPA: TetR/AcrR family transcriptional regulator [Tepidisphaeraceae bacterium]|nr:TetR/AcrR family transcriptional regulator [Tepidisphaeraceae bacterium]